MRPEDVAQRAHTRLDFVQPATVEEVRAAYAAKLEPYRARRAGRLNLAERKWP